MSSILRASMIKREVYFFENSLAQNTDQWIYTFNNSSEFMLPCQVKNHSMESINYIAVYINKNRCRSTRFLNIPSQNILIHVFRARIVVMYGIQWKKLPKRLPEPYLFPKSTEPLFWLGIESNAEMKKDSLDQPWGNPWEDHRIR